MTQIEIFKAGKRYDANGVLKDITVADLEKTVATYNPEYHEAPLVIGHPKSNNPAWGWVKGLSLDGDVLKADVDEVDAEFAEMVKDGKFKKVSAAFYLPDSPNNPHKGVLSLRHVGFLGAMPPAVKGLKQVEFAEDDLFVEFSEHPTPEPILNEPAQPEGEPEMSAEEKAELERLRAENAELKEKQAQAEAEKAEADLQAEKAGNAEFCEGLVKEGKLAPVVKAQMVQALDAISDMKAGREPEFNEGEDVLSVFKSALSASPKIIEFSEVATADKANPQENDVVQYAEGTPPDAIEMDKAVRAYMKEHNVSYTAAFNAINA